MVDAEGAQHRTAREGLAGREEVDMPDFVSLTGRRASIDRVIGDTGCTRERGNMTVRIKVQSYAKDMQRKRMGLAKARWDAAKSRV